LLPPALLGLTALRYLGSEIVKSKLTADTDTEIFPQSLVSPGPFSDIVAGDR